MSDDRPRPDIAHGVPPIAVSTTTTLANRTGSWKYMQPLFEDKVAPCNAACPVGIDLEGCMDLLREDRIEEARDLLVRENPLPAITGRLCERPCERACHRAAFDEAVNVRAVERLLGDLPPAAVPAAKAPAHRGRVAVVGSGPAGLSCAYHLARLGWSVVVLEADDEPGGWLRYGVPEYRLPRAVLECELGRIRAAGVEFRCGTRVGGELPWAKISEFDAVFLATGAHGVAALGWEQQAGNEVLAGHEFLRALKIGSPAPIGRRVVVVGGGPTALDCARSAVRLGAAVTLVFHGDKEEFKADPTAVAEALAEGVHFEVRTQAVGLETAEHEEEERALDAIGAMFDAETATHVTRLSGVRCVKRAAGPDAGAPRTFIVPADTVLVAADTEPQVDFVPAEVHRKGYRVTTDAFGRTSRAGVFAGGDVSNEPRTVAHAIGDGKRAAIGIDHYLRNRTGEASAVPDEAALRYGGVGNVSITRWRGDDPRARVNERNAVVPLADLNLAYFRPAPRALERHRAAAASDFAESDLGLSREQALVEAKRCFNCGVCTMCEQCLIFCPDLAIKRHATGRGFSLSYKYCKGCGICVAECPRGAMTLTREGL